MVAPPARRARVLWRSVIAVGVLLLGFGVWLQRTPVTDLVVRRYLAARGVPVQARTLAVGRDRLVFGDVRLGPGAAPDLTARRLTVDLGWSRLSPAVRGVRIDGAQLRLRADGRGVSFGSLDRLIPPGRSTRFPAIRLDAPGAVVAVATPAGAMTWRVDAAGRLNRDFRAVARLDGVRLRQGYCAATLAARLIATTAATEFAVTGSGDAGDVQCRGSAERIAWRADLRAPLSLQSLAASADFAQSPVRAGPWRSGAATLAVAVDGSPRAVAGRWRAAAVDVGTLRDRAARAAGSGRVAWRQGDDLRLDGSGTASGIASSTLDAAWPATTGWPTVAATLVARARAAARSPAIAAQFAASLGKDPAVRVTAFDAAGATGARLRMTGHGLTWTHGRTTVDGVFDLSGGGLPAVHAVVAADGGGSRGGFAVAPWRTGGDALTLTGGRFTLTGTRATVTAGVLVSSGVAGGRADGVRLPLTLTTDGGRIAIGNGCTPVAVARAVFGTTTVSDARATLCPRRVGPLLALAGDRLSGDLRVIGGSARGVAGRAFTIAAPSAEVRIGGTTAAPHLTTVATVAVSSGDWRGGATISATLARNGAAWSGDGSVHAATVAGPSLVARDAAFRWRVATAGLTATGATATLADPSATPRFAPLRVTGSARSAGPAITATGGVALASGAPLASVTAAFDRVRGSGTATVASTLTFTPRLQPAAISELARGLAANVAGTVTTRADLSYGPAGIGGTAQVRLNTLSLATAALGPVGGIDGTIRFDDLPHVHTPPHQTLRIATVDPGVRVDDATVAFQLLDAKLVQLERVAWPFTGGTMTLRPATLRAGEPTRAFTVVVDNLDAAQFLDRFEIKNLTATGRFDGILPLVFDGTRGRIAHGVLTARAGGGLLSYVGNVGQDEMGAAGRLAFDALRRLRYRSLAMTIDGDLDGDLVTGIDLAGTNEVPVRAAGGLPVRAAGLPFKFGVTVRAPFRALLGTAASFSDARAAIRAGKP